MNSRDRSRAGAGLSGPTLVWSNLCMSTTLLDLKPSLSTLDVLSIVYDNDVASKHMAPSCRSRYVYQGMLHLLQANDQCLNHSR